MPCLASSSSPSSRAFIAASRSQLASLHRRIAVALVGGDDRALHQQVPLPGEAFAVRGARGARELADEAADRGEMDNARTSHRVGGVLELEQARDEGAALEVLAREPLCEDIEDRQQLAGRRIRAGPRLRLQPPDAPALLAQRQEGEREVALGREVAVQGHLRDVSLGGDCVDADGAHPGTAEEDVGRVEDSLTATACLDYHVCISTTWASAPTMTRP